jgi:RNA polymerase sigma-70 factor (family 1)
LITPFFSKIKKGVKIIKFCILARNCSKLTKESFKILFEKHFGTVRNYLYYRIGDQELATDIAQEAFMRIWEKQLLKSPENSIGLVYKIANDILMSKYRRQQVEIKFQKSIDSDQLDYSPEDELQFDEMQKKYEKAISSLSENERTVFLMSRNDELKYNEIAERLNLSVKAVEKRMSKALAFLKEEMKEFFVKRNHDCPLKID